jgi:chromosome segregation ATPase
VLMENGYNIPDEHFVKKAMNVSNDEMNPKQDQMWFEEAGVAIR